MASITQTIPQYSLGMSEQPDQLKFPGQVTEITNAIPDITRGLFKRPGAKRIGTDALANVQSGGSWFHYYRDEVEGSYIGQVASNGAVRIWSCKTGAAMTVNYGTGGETALKAYLQTATPENLQFLTINDTTFVNNRDTGNANTVVGTTLSGTYSQSTTTVTVTCVAHGLVVGESVNLDFTTGSAVDGDFIVQTVADANTFTTTAAASATNSGNVTVKPISDLTPDKHFGFIELLRTENGRQYGINVNNGTTVTSLTRATRIKIESDTLDESDGSGHCPGIGTQVFSVDAASSYTGTTTNYVHDVNGSPPKTVTFSPSDVNVSNEHITISNHGMITGEPVAYSTSGSIITNLPEGNYFVVKIDDNTISLAVSLSDANNDIVKNLQGQGSGTHTLVSSGVLTTSGKNNLIFRLNILGQQGVSPNYSASENGPGGNNYRCSYNRDAILLHGGEGWVTGDRVNVTLDSASGGAGSGNDATYTILVEDHETTQVNATISSNGDGLIRPEPTPFAADTAVTADTIIGGIIEELPAGITGKHIGTGIYLSSANPFSLEVVEEDLMRCFQGSVNDVQNLPNQCKHGYIVKISNSRMSDEDDYYLRFNGSNGRDGVGSWSECAKSGIAKRLTNMPIVIQRTAVANTFEVRQFEYQERRVGDNTTNPFPSFVDEDNPARINKVLFFRNRLVFLSGENVITSRPGTLGRPDFFNETALTVSASDPVDISAASTFPSELFDGIETNTGLVVFSTNQQFLLASDDTVFNPDTAKLRSIATFNYNETIPPISLGTTIAYVDNSGKFSRFNEMANITREGEPSIVEVSKVVPTLLPKSIDLLTNSRENSIILLGKTGSDTVLGYKYFQVSEQRQQAAWFKWKLNNPLTYHFIINDEYFFLDSDYYLQSIRLVQTETDPSTVINNVDFLLHVDNHTTVSGGSYDPASNITTFSGVGWLNTVTSPNHELVIIDEGGTPAPTDGQGRYAKVSVSGTQFTVSGNWQGETFTIGYLYPYQVKFPTFYATRSEGSSSRADVNSSLVLHRLKLHFGKVGLYETTLSRVGKSNYTEVYESTIMDGYNASRSPYLEEHIQTVPVYEKNTNVDVTLTSSHPAPATLRALSWEGDYSPKFYKRV